MSDQFDWSAPPLDPDDQRLVETYKSFGRALDDLAYTPEFESLVRALGVEDTIEARHLIYQRLLSLRKRGRLPRIGRLAAH